jgi:hypothetical protein
MDRLDCSCLSVDPLERATIKFQKQTRRLLVVVVDKKIVAKHADSFVCFCCANCHHHHHQATKQATEPQKLTMCRGPSSTKDAVGSTQQRLLLVSKESFAGHEKEIPNPLSMTVTGGFVVAFLVMMELTLRQLFWSIKVGFF